MWRLVAALMLAAVGSTAMAQGGLTYREASESLGEMATLRGRAVSFADLETDWTLPRSLKPQEPGALKALIRERALNRFRELALRELASELMPDCPAEATAADLQAFYPYWRDTIAKEGDRLADMGGEAAKTEAALAKAGFVLPERVPMAEMAEVDASLPGAESNARDAIRNWKLDHCLQATFGGDRFFSTLVGRDGQWPVGPRVTWWSKGNERAMPVPSLALEPLTARGRFFRAAEAKGLLSFSKTEDAAYFFQRYEGERYDNVRDDSVAVAFLATAPWAP